MNPNPPPGADSHLLPAVDRGTPALHRLASIIGGMIVSSLILIGISRAQKTQIPPQSPPIEELRAMVIEPPPPPPSQAKAEPSAVRVREVELEPQPKEDGIAIAAAILAPTIPVPPVPEHLITLNFDMLSEEAEEAPPPSATYVFQSTQVDQRPMPLYRKTPDVTRRLLDSVKNPRATLLFVVNVDGSVEDIHVLRAPSKEFGEVMVDAVKEWRFSPAKRAGRKVRCLVQLPIFVRPPNASPFSLN
ncbi:MAG TPA: energy transducer TonB [Opitutaceae bacterium]